MWRERLRMSATDNQIVPVLVKHPEIRLAVLFGSLAVGGGRPDSDLDLAIDAGAELCVEDKIALMGELADATGRPVDLVDLRTAGEPLLGQVVVHGRRLIGSDEAYAELIRRHLFDEADFMPYYRRILAERRQAWIAP